MTLHRAARALGSWLVLTAPLTAPATAQGRFVNARVRGATAARGLAPAVRAIVESQATPAWIAYDVPMAGGDRFICCGSSVAGAGRTRGCALESGRRAAAAADPTASRGLEGDRQLVVLLRGEGRRVGVVRIASDGCVLDAGGLTVYRIAGATANRSVALLQSMIGGRRPLPVADAARTSEGALTALAFHAGAEATAVLVSAARGGGTARMRGGALFWLAQRAGREATAAIADAVANDPETEVKQKAVFALSQLPKDEGVPLLIQVARTNRNAAVRKTAMFWLGESKDPRAVAFFEEILAR